MTRKVAKGVSGGRFNLRDAGTVVGEHHGAHWTGYTVRQIKYHQTVENTGHVSRLGLSHRPVPHWSREFD